MWCSTRMLVTSSLVVVVMLGSVGCDTSLPSSNPYDPDLPAHQKEPASLTGVVALESGLPTAATV